MICGNGFLQSMPHRRVLLLQVLFVGGDVRPQRRFIGLTRHLWTAATMLIVEKATCKLTRTVAERCALSHGAYVRAFEATHLATEKFDGTDAICEGVRDTSYTPICGYGGSRSKHCIQVHEAPRTHY